MKKNIVIILVLTTISCTFNDKNSDKALSSELSCKELFTYDQISCLKNQIQSKSKNDTSLFIMNCELAEAYFRINDKIRFTETVKILDNSLINTDLNDRLYFKYLIIKGCQYYELKEFREAIDIFNKAVLVTENSEDTSLLFPYYKIGVCFEKMKNLDSAEYYFKKALNKKQFIKNIYTNQIASLYNAIAYIFRAKYYDTYNAKLYYDSVELISNNIPVLDSSTYAWNLFNIGAFYHQVNNAKKAEHYYSEALKVYSQYNTFIDEIATVSLNQAYTYSAMEKYELAHSKIDWNIIHYTKNFNPGTLLNLYSEKAYIYFRERKNKEAIQYYKKALDIDNKYLLNSKEYMLNFIAWCYVNENMPDSAEYYFKECMRVTKSKPVKDAGNLVSLYGEYSKMLIKKREYKKALEIINTNLPEIIERIGTNNSPYGYFIYWKALAYEKMGNYELSLNIYQEIIDISTNKTHTNIYDLPDFKVTEINEHDNLIDALIGKGTVLEKMSYTPACKIQRRNFHEKSLKHFEKAYEVVMALNQKIESESDRLQFTGKKSFTTEKILTNAYALYELTREQKYLEKAFTVADLGKATQVILGLKDDEYKRISRIPENITKREKDLQEEISLIQNTLREEKYSTKVDSSLIISLNNKLYKTIGEYEELTKVILNKYPHYNRLKYSGKSIEIDSLKKHITPDKMLITYTFAGDTLYSFLLSNKILKVNAIKLDGLKDSILVFRKALTEINDTSFMYEGIKQYVPIAYWLYEKLLKPFETDIDGKNLILIPDGILNLLPFEALITSNDLPLKTDYALLPYVVYKHSICYAYSAELFTLRNKIITTPTSKVLAYAPEYNNTLIKRPSSKEGIEESIILGQLRGSQEEVTQISKTFGGKAVLGKNATKLDFKNNCSDNSIIHLSMHTIIDNEYPMYSKLVFSPSSDTGENAYLNTYEIYNLNFKAPLVVLSACNTGYGKILKGEGIISLARGFLYSGCPSLVITLWSIADRSSSNLMQGFYKNLETEQDVDVALQKAKIQYINSSDQRLSHPYFWAGYIQTGKTVPVYKAESKLEIYIIIGISFIILSGLLYFRIRKKKSSIS